MRVLDWLRRRSKEPEYDDRFGPRMEITLWQDGFRSVVRGYLIDMEFLTDHDDITPFGSTYKEAIRSRSVKLHGRVAPWVEKKSR